MEIDESTRKKIIDIIDHQFDLEIYLKQREVATIKREIAKAESVLQDLKLAVENGMRETRAFFSRTNTDTLLSS